MTRNGIQNFNVLLKIKPLPPGLVFPTPTRANMDMWDTLAVTTIDSPGDDSNLGDGGTAIFKDPGMSSVAKLIYQSEMATTATMRNKLPPYLFRSFFVTSAHTLS